MALTSSETVPLYVHTIYRILREMRVVQQEVGGKFSYREFKRQVMDSGLSPAQLGPLHQRLDTLESFMPKAQVDVGHAYIKKKKRASTTSESDWNSKVCDPTKLRNKAKYSSRVASRLSTFLALV